MSFPRQIVRGLVFAPVLASLAGCGGSDLGAGFVELPVAVTSQVATGSAGVSSAHPLATQAGVEVLESGGNAVDAAVATGLVLSVVENSMSGLGGRAQILMRDSSGEILGIDAQSQLGSDYSSPLLIPSFSGINVVGVPGMVAGLVQLHQRYGSKSLEQVAEAAIQYARNGYRILPGEVSRHQRVEDTIRKSPELASIYLNQDGAIHQPGDLFVQKDLANTLSEIAVGGAEAFYRGDIGRKMAEDIKERNGPVVEDDIRSYEARSATIIRAQYRGYTVVGTTSPANGTAVIAALKVLDHLDMSSLTETEWANVVSQVMASVMQRTVFEDADDEDYQTTLSDAYITDLFDALELPSTTIELKPDVARVTSSARSQTLAMSVGQVDWSGARNGEHSHHTTHYVAADDNGMIVSITQTLGPNMGSKVMTSGLGFIYAQTGGMPAWVSSDKPGDRPRTSIAPVIVLKDGVPVMALGAAGGLMIPPAIVQVISRVIDRGESLEEAISAPRVAPKFSKLPPGGFKKDAIVLEATPVNGWSKDNIVELEAAGIEVAVREKYSLFGRVNAMAYSAETGAWTAVADPDWEGSSLATKP